MNNPLYLITRIRHRGLNPSCGLRWILILTFILVEFRNLYELCICGSPPLDTFNQQAIWLDLKLNKVIHLSVWGKKNSHLYVSYPLYKICRHNQSQDKHIEAVSSFLLLRWVQTKSEDKG